MKQIYLFRIEGGELWMGEGRVPLEYIYSNDADFRSYHESIIQYLNGEFFEFIIEPSEKEYYKMFKDSAKESIYKLFKSKIDKAIKKVEKEDSLF